MKSGIINVYKEKGYTSFDVVAKLRGILHIKKIGHTGTLDPEAEGVLPICIGKATKVSDMLTDTDKTYVTTLLLGKATDTYDIYGRVINEKTVNTTPEEVESVIKSYVGVINQIPPMYSAIKLNGKRLYELARLGKEVERKPRQVTIYNEETLSINLPRVRFQVTCSKGTYIRSLCNDIGNSLNTYGCMEDLIRTRVGQFCIEDSLHLDDVSRLFDEHRINEAIIPIDAVLNKYPSCYIMDTYKKLCINGSKIPVSSVVDFDANRLTYKNCDNMFRMYLQDNTFVGLYSKIGDTFVPKKMFYENI